MGLLDEIEKLINEHGSATILKERMALANDKYSLLEDKKRILEERNTVLEKKIKDLEIEKQTFRQKFQEAEQKIKQLEGQLAHSQASNPDGYVCDHCGSPSLKRTGSRPDPTFGDLGVKQKLYVCNVCGKQSAFTPHSREI